MLHTRDVVSRSVRRHGFGIGRTGLILIIGLERCRRRHATTFGRAGIRRVFPRRWRDLYLGGAPCEDEQAERE